MLDFTRFVQPTANKISNAHFLFDAQLLQEAELKEKQERSNAIAAFTAPRKKKSEARKFTLPPGERFSGAVFLTLLKRSRAVVFFGLFY